jgi:hypothetical protein
MTPTAGSRAHSAPPGRVTLPDVASGSGFCQQLASGVVAEFVPSLTVARHVGADNPVV